MAESIHDKYTSIWEEHDACVNVLKAEGHTDLSIIIEELIKIYWDLHGADAYEINCGDCKSFACDLINIYGDGIGLWHDEMPDCTPQEADYWSHCFAKINNKYYDSESPEGVDNWRDLPCFLRDGLVTSVDTFSATQLCTTTSPSKG